MQIAIEWFSGKYQQFNVALSTGDKEPFITIKGCRIVDGSKGQFVSWPATKRNDGKYWNHVYASEAFAAAVLDKALKSRPDAAQAERDEMQF